MVFNTLRVIIVSLNTNFRQGITRHKSYSGKISGPKFPKTALLTSILIGYLNIQEFTKRGYIRVPIFLHGMRLIH